MRRLKIGVGLPVYSAGMMDHGDARWRELAAYAQHAEAVGFDSVWVEDHLLFRFGDGRTEGAWECFSLLAALAAVTSRVELGTIVTCTSFRNPALLAKMVDTIDEISGGRVTLGLGAGWHAPEYRAFGYPFDHRVSRFEEALQIVHGLLHDGQIDFSGRYYTARECELRPRGPRPAGVPIMLGSSSPRMLSIGVRYADSWNSYFRGAGNSPAGVVPLREQVDAACLAAGRDPGTLARSVAVLVDVRGGSPISEHFRAGVQPLSGSAEEIAAGLRAYAAVGVSHLQLFTVPMLMQGVDALAPILEAFDSMERG